MSKLRIVVVVGLPGSGKSTWLADNHKPAISSDHMRELLSDEVTNQNIHAKVFAAVRYFLRQRILLGRPVTYVDATNLTPWERRQYLEIGRKYSCELEALFFNVPLEECKKRNRLRARVVPDEVLERMSRKLVKPSKAEGFSRVRVVSP